MLLRFNMQLQIVGFIMLFAVTNEVSCECGTLTFPLNRGYGDEPEIFPWHVLIYQRSKNSHYSLKCAGTITKLNTVVSAAHCFYNETGKTIFDASSFKVAAAKYFTPYNWNGANTQKVEIKTINLINGYQGSTGSFSKDIAWLILEKPFNKTEFVKPVCTDFDNITDKRNLQRGQIGKTIGCHRLMNSMCYAKLGDKNYSFIPRDECRSTMPESRKPYITNDKFCAACLNDEFRLSNTDSGSGLHFQYNGKWYLRGVLSFINYSDNTYNSTNPVVFSDVRNFNYEFTRRRQNPDIIKCGTTPALNDVGHYISNGYIAKYGQYPWHVGIYSITPSAEYELICSGSLINPRVVISAAHCFWDNGLKAKINAGNFSIAAGKIYNKYNWPERYVQKSGIQDIYIREKYYGEDKLQAEDIAWLILEHPMNITNYVRPVCLDLNNEHGVEDLRSGRIGKVAGWGFTEVQEPSDELMQLNLPVVEFNQCESTVPQDFRPFITFDKFCAGYTNGSSLCNGDSGGGLVFKRNEQWYLRGIVSVGPRNGSTCDNKQYTLFTNVGLFTEDLYRFANFNDNDIIQ